jgi:hypothetical protein
MHRVGASRGIGGLGGLTFGGLTAYNLAMPAMRPQSFSHYVGLQVGSTHNIADMERTVPRGLLISTDSKGDIIVQHQHLRSLDVSLIGKDGNPVGLLAVLDAVADKKNFPNTQKLTLSMPTYSTEVSWEYSQPPGLVKSLAQGVVGIGAWLGEKLGAPRVMPSSWIESINYIPVEKGWMEKPPSDWVVPCTHSSAADTSKTDRADEVPEFNDEDDYDPCWNRDTLDDDETIPTAVVPETPDVGERTDSVDTHEPTSVEEDTSGGWDYTPYYDGFNGDADGGVGMGGHKTIFD